MRHCVTERRRRRGLVKALAGAAFVFTVLGLGSVACGEQGEQDARAAITPSAEVAAPTPLGPAVAPMSESEPVEIEIPALGVTSDVMDLGLQSDGSMEVPPGAYPAGWYTGAPTPGELGPAIIAAHVDWNGEPGVFHQIDQLEPGDDVIVRREDGSTAIFTVDRVDQYPKDEFPTDAVYGNIDHAGLRLITCGGDFNGDEDSYVDNIVVYASFTGSSSGG